MNPDELPDFPLAPWELPPDSTEPLVAPATMRWHGELFGREADWLVRVVPSSRHMFVADLLEPSGNWWFGTVPESSIASLDELVPRLLGVKPHTRTRLIHLRDESGVCQLLLRTEWFCHIQQAGKSSDIFSIEFPFDFAQTDSAQVFAEVLRAWNDADSDLNFARRWISLSEDEKDALSVSWRRGDKTGFLRMTQVVLRAFAPRIVSGFWQWNFHIRTGEFCHVEVASDNLDDEVEHSNVLRLWGEAISEVFGPRWNEELARQHPCAREEDAHGGSHYFVQADERTAHEQLEAARELSAWLDEREARGELDAPTLARLRDTLH